MGINLDEVEWAPAETLWDDTGEAVPTGLLVKVLSVDAGTGASTVLVKAPPGWTTDAPEVHSVLQEGFILEGTYHNGDVELRAPAYFCLPPGTVHGPARSEGHVVLSMLSGPLDITHVTAES
jgi:hypothetical protein